MADEIIGVTIPELPEGGTLTGAEQFEMVQDGVSRRTTADEIKTLVGAVTGITSTDGSISIDLTDPSAPDLSIPNGAFEPTITNEAGLTSTSVTAGFYSRSGDIVTASFSIGFELAALSVNATLDFSLPILPAANFANSRKLTGVFSVNSGLLSSVNFITLASTSGAKTASLELQTSVAAVSVGLNIIIQYSLV